MSSNIENIKEPRITIGIPTMNRYENLAMLFWSISQQTYKNFDILVVDDSTQPCDLVQIPFMINVIQKLLNENHKVVQIKGQQSGPHISHQIILEKAENELILRVDDDCIMTPTYIEKLVECFIAMHKSKDKTNNEIKVAGIGGVILLPAIPEKDQVQPEKWHSMEPFMGKCLQRPDGNVVHSPALQQFMHLNQNYKPTEHLHSSFLYKKSYALAIGGFPRDYSQVGHNEETDFSFRFHLMGYKMFITPRAILWHNQSPVGGIRQNTKKEFNKKEMWDKDYQLFLYKWHEYWKKGKIRESVIAGGNNYKS